MDRKMAEFIKEQYPPGTRIRLNSMDDPYAPIAPGTEGEVDFVDDIGPVSYTHLDLACLMAGSTLSDTFYCSSFLNNLKLFIEEVGIIF